MNNETLTPPSSISPSAHDASRSGVLTALTTAVSGQYQRREEGLAGKMEESESGFDGETSLN